MDRLPQRTRFVCVLQPPAFWVFGVIFLIFMKSVIDSLWYVDL